MADKIVLNTPRYKGEYKLDFDDPVPSALEWRWVKKISGYYVATAADGYRNSDPDFFIALACIALVRAGRISRDEVYTVADELAELPLDGNTLRYITGEDEDDAGPPAEQASVPETEPQHESTGASSSSILGRPEPSPSPIGAPD